MKGPLLHPRTNKQLEIYLKQKPHGALLVGEAHIGKRYIAKWLANQLESEITVVEKPEKQSSITIDQIRNLYSQTKTGRKQMIIIDNAQLMGKEAQNAFLKLLEEPPENTLFILTVTSPEALLQTIRSRAQQIDIIRPTEQAFIDYFQTETTEFLQQIRQCDYLPALLANTLEGKFNTAMADAKRFYTSDSYARHIWLINNKYEKDTVQELINNLTLILQSLVLAKSNDSKSLKKLIKQIELLDATKKSVLAIPGNPKIHLTKLAEML